MKPNAASTSIIPFPSSSVETVAARSEMQPKEVVDVGLYITEWSKCLTAKYQRDQLYRLGKFDDCSRQWNDLKTAAWAKLYRDEQEARKAIESTYNYQRATISPTAGVIWELKETPGWD